MFYEINNTSNIANAITKQFNNNYENSIIKIINTRIANINYNSGYNELTYHNRKPINKQSYCNFYNDTFNFRKIENISLSQQTYITNNIIETNTQTINHIGNT